MSNGEPPAGPEPTERIAAALAGLGRAMAELAASFRPLVQPVVQPVVETLARLGRDPRVQAAVAADREPSRPGCHCLCWAVHRGDPGICEGVSLATVRISGMDVPMCAPCQAARAASKLSGQT